MLRGINRRLLNTFRWCACFRLCGRRHRRKNHYSLRSERGTRVAAVCYSLLESAKLAGLEPAAYLAEATRRAIANPGTVTLPRDLLAERTA